MAEMGRELNWDDEITKDSSFVELPPGDYDFTVDHYERSPRYNTPNRRTRKQSPKQFYMIFKVLP